MIRNKKIVRQQCLERDIFSVWKTNCLLFMSFLIISGCSKNEKFEKNKWNQKNDLGYYDYRESMLEDVVKNYQLKGKSIQQLRNMFGELDIFYEKMGCQIQFNIITEFGANIDPIYSKDLIFKLNADSIIVDVHVTEFKR
jgi:hypothetical protein